MRVEKLVTLTPALLSLWLAVHPSLQGAEVTGTVRDEFGLPIRSVRIKVTSLDTGVIATVGTDEQGRYRVTVPDSARYEVEAWILNFQPQADVVSFPEKDFKLKQTFRAFDLSMFWAGPPPGQVLDPSSSNFIDADACVCGDTLLATAVKKDGNQDIGGAWVFDLADRSKPALRQSLPGLGGQNIFNPRCACLAGNTPAIVANLTAPNNQRRIAIAKSPNFQFETLPQGTGQFLDLDVSGRYAMAYNTQVRGELHFWDLEENRHLGSWGPPAGGGVIWGGLQGVTAPSLVHRDDRFFSLYEEVFNSFTNLRLGQFGVDPITNQITPLRNTQLGRGPTTTGAGPHGNADLMSMGDYLVALVTNRSELFNELLVVDPLRLERVGKPHALDDPIPTGWTHSKKLIPRDDFTFDTLTARPGASTSLGALVLTPYTLTHAGALSKLSSFSLDETTLNSPVAGAARKDDLLYIPKTGGSLHLGVVQAMSPPLVFAQFADGGGIFSQITLSNPDRNREARVRLRLRDQAGANLRFNRNGRRLTLPGTQLNGELQVTIPGGGQVEFETDGGGQVVVGSVAAESAVSLSGVIVFGGPFGLTGVLPGELLEGGFSAPMEVSSSRSINTGLALVNLEPREVRRRFFLLDDKGVYRAKAELVLPANGQRALFLNEFPWDTPPPFTEFRGLLLLTGGGLASGTVIQTRPGQFAAIPLTPR